MFDMVSIHSSNIKILPLGNVIREFANTETNNKKYFVLILVYFFSRSVTTY